MVPYLLASLPSPRLGDVPVPPYEKKQLEYEIQELKKELEVAEVIKQDLKSRLVRVESGANAAAPALEVETGTDRPGALVAGANLPCQPAHFGNRPEIQAFSPHEGSDGVRAETAAAIDAPEVVAAKSLGAASPAGQLPTFVNAASVYALAAGADGLIIEVHQQPDLAWSDGRQSLKPRRFAQLVKETRAIALAVGRDVQGQRPTVSANGQKEEAIVASTLRV